MKLQLLKKIKSFYIVFSAVSFCILTLTNCKYNKADILYPTNTNPVGCASISATFNANVSPIIITKCAIAGCHNSIAAGGVILQNYAQIFDAKDRINERAIIEKTMPISSPLSASEINIIKCWLESGAPNN